MYRALKRRTVSIKTEEGFTMRESLTALKKGIMDAFKKGRREKLKYERELAKNTDINWESILQDVKEDTEEY